MKDLIVRWHTRERLHRRGRSVAGNDYLKLNVQFHVIINVTLSLPEADFCTALTIIFHNSRNHGGITGGARPVTAAGTLQRTFYKVCRQLNRRHQFHPSDGSACVWSRSDCPNSRRARPAVHGGRRPIGRRPMRTCDTAGEDLPWAKC